MRGTGIFLATGLITGFFIGKSTGYPVWGTILGLVAGVGLAILTNWLLNKNK
jgi:hypothetical protein